MCYVVFCVVCSVCSGVFFFVLSQNNDNNAECGAGKKNGLLIIFVVFTVKNLTFSYSDFMFFCDFRSIVLIQCVKKNNCTVLKIMTPNKAR